MDSLALLCTLHADGPTTLQRLRAGGVSVIEDLLALDPDDVRRLVPGDTGRLVREGRLLVERVSPLEGEAPETPRAPTAPRQSPPVARASRRADASWRVDPGRVERTTALPVAPEPTPPTIEVAETSPPRVTGTVLAAGILDDLDLELCEALARAGVRSVEELVSGSGLSLARKVGVPFTRLLELQLRAQNLRDSAPRPPAAPAPALAPTTPPDARTPCEVPRDRRLTDRLSPAAPRRESDATGGPFA